MKRRAKIIHLTINLVSYLRSRFCRFKVDDLRDTSSWTRYLLCKTGDSSSLIQQILGLGSLRVVDLERVQFFHRIFSPQPINSRKNTVKRPGTLRNRAIRLGSAHKIWFVFMINRLNWRYGRKEICTRFILALLFSVYPGTITETFVSIQHQSQFSN